MRAADAWKDYELLDCSDGERLERWGEIILVRPDPQVIWKTQRKDPLWYDPHAHYRRSAQGGGAWDIRKKIPDSWSVNYKELKFNVKTMGFKHTGVFPEQAVNWDLLSSTIKSAQRQLKVLNLFAYTGAATVACLKAGAAVVHVDAAKGMVNWAKENATSSGLAEMPVRWIVDDCIKFVQREIRRGNVYDIILMDPPSYGRGPGGEVWNLESEIYSLVERCTSLLNERSLMLMINSYTTGFSPSTVQYILGDLLAKKLGGTVSGDEIGLPVTASGLVLPCGATSVWHNRTVK
ncbi:MAG TPA: class I SAM-dependent methyltransferase [Clostridia bacterium]|nr:class I SAM-dependent methyltransferase [Clostridia bacterium]